MDSAYSSLSGVFQLYAALFKLVDKRSVGDGEASAVTQRLMMPLNPYIRSIDRDVLPRSINGHNLDHELLSKVLHTNDVSVDTAAVIVNILLLANARAGIDGRTKLSATVSAVILEHTLGGPRFNARVRDMACALVESQLRFPWYDLDVAMTAEDLRVMYLSEYKVGGREHLVAMTQREIRSAYRRALDSLLDQIDNPAIPLAALLASGQSKAAKRSRAASSPEEKIMDASVASHREPRKIVKAKRTLPAFIRPLPTPPPVVADVPMSGSVSGSASTSRSKNSIDRLVSQMRTATLGTKRRKI